MFNGFLSPSKQSRLGIKIVLINITNGTTAVVASGFQRPLFGFYANSIDGLETESIALTFWQVILRKSRFQVSKQNNQGPEVVWFCSDPNNESDPSSEYSPLGLTHVMNQ